MTIKPFLDNESRTNFKIEFIDAKESEEYLNRLSALIYLHYDNENECENLTNRICLIFEHAYLDDKSGKCCIELSDEELSTISTLSLCLTAFDYEKIMELIDNIHEISNDYESLLYYLDEAEKNNQIINNEYTKLRNYYEELTELYRQNARTSLPTCFRKMKRPMPS